MTGGGFEKILEAYAKLASTHGPDPVEASKRLLAGDPGPSEELVGFAEQAKNGTLPRQLDPVSSAATAADGVLQTASTMELAILAGYKPFDATKMAAYDLQANLTQPGPATDAKIDPTAYLQATQEGGGPPAGMFPNPATLATQTILQANPGAVFNPGSSVEAVEKSFDSSTATEVKTNLVDIAKADETGKDVFSVVSGMVSDTERYTPLSEWENLILPAGPIRDWLNAQTTNQMDYPDSDIAFPEGEDWWDDLEPGTRQDLLYEVNRRVGVYRAFSGSTVQPDPGGPDTATDVEAKVKAAEAGLGGEFGDTKFESTAGPLSAYSALVDQNGVPLHGQIYQSLAMHALPQSMRYMRHVGPAIQRRLPTMMGAWYLGGLLQDRPPTMDDPSGPLGGAGASKFVNFVMRGGNPFDIGLTPKDTRDDFKKWVYASRTSLEDLEATKDAAERPSDFLVRYELANPQGSAYDPTVERNILKAQAGWTGIGERGRMREAVLTMMEDMHRRKRLMDPTYTEGLLAYASTWEGSPWWVPSKPLYGTKR